MGRRALDARASTPVVPEPVDDDAWRTLEDTGLARLTSEQDAGVSEAAVVLHGLARHLVAAPAAETDVLAGWLAATAGLKLPADGTATVALATTEPSGGRLVGTAAGVPWPGAATVLLAVRAPDATYVAVLPPWTGTPTANPAGEPRAAVEFDVAVEDAVRLPAETYDELLRRGAWARCVQIVGAFDAAVELTTAHVRERQQFGRPLNAFQAVQHSLAGMIGEVERARAVTALATAAADDHGFGSPQSDFAVTAAKVAVGRAVASVSTTAHQLHGAIGVTVEHRLWLATMRARSWADEFGTPAHHARRLGRMALAAPDPWDLVVGLGF
nr:acyl-CoA dehydrogenase family protein [Mycolicibacterium sediminis]